MSAIQFISRHAASLICHLGGGVHHLATEMGSQGIQITAVTSLALMRSSSRDYWCVVRSWFFLPQLYGTVKHLSSTRHVGQWCTLQWYSCTCRAILLYLIFTQRGPHMIKMLAKYIWERGNVKGFSWIICIFFCFVCRHLRTLSNQAGSEGRDPLHSELCHICLDIYQIQDLKKINILQYFCCHVER